MDVRDWYEGRCPRSGQLLRLPRTTTAEAIACDLMQHLATDPAYSREGKMYGVLLVETPSGTQQVLKAFSGLLHGESLVAGWVPPIPGREQVILEETRTLEQLEALKQALIQLQSIPERQTYVALAQEFELRLRQLAQEHAQRRHDRQHLRQQTIALSVGEEPSLALAQLDDQSRRDGMERRQLKRQRDEALQPLRQTIEAADTRIQAIKQQRKALSRQLQTQMHAAYRLTNFAGESRSLPEVIAGGGLPTGTGDCCAPKLLHYAATHGLKPLALAEFWWGPPLGDKVQGRFYGACVERCQPIMGFLLSGLTPTLPSLTILYEDDWLLAVDKPAGLLSVPGRSLDHQDSVLSRLRYGRSEGLDLMPVHRLDQATSGILLLARDGQTYRQLSQQFQHRRVHKVYEAILDGTVVPDRGTIDLPLWSDPTDRPYQRVDRLRGKPSLTHFRVIARTAITTRLELTPVTGRTHQLRVHAAAPEGLGIPIVGDRLYGEGSGADRLYLHARGLRCRHPHSGEWVHLHATPPF
ncbi:RNA pseudouridine synthase [Leptolyngbya sp. 'hensonii']|nr:RNA pseudouridine synthase [Leptolyngbya sp. 'hensonii']